MGLGSGNNVHSYQLSCFANIICRLSRTCTLHHPLLPHTHTHARTERERDIDIYPFLSFFLFLVRLMLVYFSWITGLKSTGWMHTQATYKAGYAFAHTVLSVFTRNFICLEFFSILCQLFPTCTQFWKKHCAVNMMRI